jgi:hypothetical protein
MPRHVTVLWHLQLDWKVGVATFHENLRSNTIIFSLSKEAQHLETDSAVADHG